MKSEIIVVIVLIALAIGFILWVRRHDQDHDVLKNEDE
jgi:uncharacterized membrane protein YhfC